MSSVTGWFRDNQVLAIALLGQAIIAGIYMVNLEARVSTLEIRGSPNLENIHEILTVMEIMTYNYKERIDRLVDKATK